MAEKKKDIKNVLKLIIPGGQATPAPPLGPILGQNGVNIGLFTQEFNDKTREMMGNNVNVELTVMKDGSFKMKIMGPTTEGLLKKAAGIKKGTGVAKDKVGKVTAQQVREIAEIKMPYLNTADMDAAVRIVEGTAKSLGLEIVK